FSVPPPAGADPRRCLGLARTGKDRPTAFRTSMTTVSIQAEEPPPRASSRPGSPSTDSTARLPPTTATATARPTPPPAPPPPGARADGAAARPPPGSRPPADSARPNPTKGRPARTPTRRRRVASHRPPLARGVRALPTRRTRGDRRPTAPAAPRPSDSERRRG